MASDCRPTNIDPVKQTPWARLRARMPMIPKGSFINSGGIVVDRSLIRRAAPAYCFAAGALLPPLDSLGHRRWAAARRQPARGPARASIRRARA